jgi:hypothetical protein
MRCGTTTSPCPRSPAISASRGTPCWSAIKPHAETLIKVPGRVRGVKTIGVDEHIWRPSRVSSTDKAVTVMVDLTRDADGCLHARLLDAVQAAPGGSMPSGSASRASRSPSHVASKLLARTSPRNIAATGLTLAATGAALLSTASGTAQFATNLLPGLLVLGLGVGRVFVAVAVTAMTGIPPQHAAWRPDSS